MLARNATQMPSGLGDHSDPFQLAQQQLNVAARGDQAPSIVGVVRSADPSVSLGGPSP